MYFIIQDAKKCRINDSRRTHQKTTLTLIILYSQMMINEKQRRLIEFYRVNPAHCLSPYDIVRDVMIDIESNHVCFWIKREPARGTGNHYLHRIRLVELAELLLLYGDVEKDFQPHKGYTP